MKKDYVNNETNNCTDLKYRNLDATRTFSFLRDKNKIATFSKLMSMFFFVALLFSTNANSQVTITKPNLTINVCSGYPSAFNALGDIVIAESANNNFSNGTGVTLVLSAPANFRFQAGTGTVTFTAAANLSAVSVAVTNNTITVTYTCGGAAKTDTMTISGILVRATNNASTGDITRTAGTGTINGLVNATTLTNTLTSVTGTTPTISVQPVPKSVCTNGTTTFSVTASGATTYQWQRNGVDLSNVAPYSNVTNSTLTISNPATTDAGNFTCVLNASTCPIISASAALTVNAIPVITVQPSTPTAVCAGLASVSLSVTATGATTYQWRKNGVNLTNTAPYSNVTTSTLNITNPAFSENGASFDVVVGNAAPCSVTSTARTLTVNPIAAISAQPVATSACTNTTATFSITASNVTTYQWQRNGVNIANGAPYSGVTTATLTISSPAVGIAGNFTCILNSATCPVTSSSAALTVNAAPVITVQPIAPAAFCEGSASPSLSVTATGATTYQWRKNGVNLTNTAPYSNVTTSTLNITNPAFAENGASLDVVVSNASGCSVTSTARILIINAVSVISAQPVATSACTNTTVTFSITASNVTTYQWQRNGVNIANGAPYSGVTTATLTITNPAIGIAGNFTCLLNSATCLVTSSSVALTVNAAPVITTQPSTPAATCENASTSFSVVASSATTYQWRKNGVNLTNTAPYSNVTTATLDITNPPFTENGASFDVVVGNAVGCSVQSITRTLTVRAVPVISVQPVSVSACTNQTVTFNITASNVTTYQWVRNGLIISNSAPYSGVFTSTLTITNPTAGNAGNFTCILNSATCPVTSSAGVLTVNTAPVITVQPTTPASVCAGSGVRTIGVTATSATTYQWRKNGVNLSNVAPYSNVTTPTLTITNPSLSENGASFDVVIGNAALCSVTSNAVSLTVNPVSVISIQPIPTSVCTNAIATLSINATSVTTYQWQRNGVNLTNTAPYSGVTTSLLTITNPAVAEAGNFTCVLNSATCPVTSSSVALTVNAIPVISTQPATPSPVCAGSGSTSLTVSASGGPSYQWRKNGVNLTNTAPYSGVTTATLNITNPSTSENGVNLDVVLTNGAGCSVLSTARILTVNVVPIISVQPASTSACTNTSAIFSITASNIVTYQWRRNGVNLTNTAPYSNVTTATLTVTNPALTDSGTFTCVLNSATCPITSANANLTVNAIPVIVTQPATPTAVCAGAGTRTLTVVATGATSYQWRKNGVNLTNAVPYSTVTTATLTITNPAATENGASFDVVVSNAAGCSVISITRTLSVNSAPSNVTTPSPAHNSTGNCYAGTGAVNTIYWAANAAATSYDVYFGTAPSPVILSGNVATNSYFTGTLAANTTYYWRVVAKNSCGSAAGPSIWNFTTKSGATCYCVPTASSGVHGTGITNVTYSTVNNTTSNTTVYNDYSTLIGSALQGASMPISIRTATASNNYNVNVWVDWNNNADFVDAGESVFSGQVNSNTINGTIAIPLTATIGNHRMRVGIVRASETAIPCFAGVRGAFEDYTLNITAAAACTIAPAVSTNPVDSTILNGGTTSFSASFINNPTSYIWEISTDGGYNFSTLTSGGVYSGATTATLTITGATGNMDGFIYRVSASNACGTSSVSAQADLIVTTSYCIPSSSSGTVYITTVSTDGNLGDNSNSPTTYSTGGYGNYSAMKIATQIPGGGINLNINLNALNYVWAYIDWNGDGDFTDFGEAFYYSKYGILNTTIGLVVPTNQGLGNYRMRIRTRSASAVSAPAPSPCTAYADGETEDYTITVVPPCAALIQSVTNGSVCGTNLPVTMTAVGLGGATKYRWYTTATGGAYEAETNTGSYSPTLNVTTIYYVTAYNGSCESLIRTRVVATVTPITNISFNPAAPVTCGENTVITISSDLNDVAVLDLFYETFESGGFGGFTSNTVPTPVNPGADTPWSVKANTYQSTSTDVWKPAISSGAIATNFALTSSDYAGASNIVTRLTTTSAMDATGYVDLTLTFDHFFSWYGTSAAIENAKVQISIDGGANFTDLVTYSSDQGAGTDFKSEVIDLSSYVGQTNLKLRFQYTAAWKDGWAIDNVRFFGTKQLSPTFTWTSATPVAGFIDFACTTPYVAQPVTSIYLRPTLAQLENGSFPITVISTLASGCPTSTVITVNNNSRIWKGTDISNPTEWNSTSNWLPATVPTPDNCVIIPNSTIISGTGFKAYAKNVIVKSTGNLEIQSSNFLTVTDFVKVDTGGIFTVRNSASLIQVNNTAINQGNIDMDRVTNVRKLDYAYWSSPVASFSSASISPDTSTNYIYKWNPTIANSNNGQGNWVNGNEIMTAGKGYIVRGPDTYTSTPAAYISTMSGTPFNGIIQNSITRGDITSVAGTYPAAPYAGTNGVTITSNTDNWNLVGNPYPSAIDALSFINLNAVTNGTIVGNVRVWTHGTSVNQTNANAFYSTFGYNYSTSDYINYNGTGPSIPGFDGYIGAGQGFFVLMNEAPVPQTSTVTFNNSMRSDLNRNDQFYRATSSSETNLNTIEKNRIWLSLVNPSNVANTTLVGYVTGATMSQDIAFDAPHKVGAASTIYSMINNDPMIIQGRPTPFNSNDTVPIGLIIPSNGIYNIAISKIDGLFEDTAQGIYLEDTTLGIIHNLRSGPYSFAAVTGTFNSRFILRYTNATLGTENPHNDNQTFAFISNNQLIVQSIDSIKEVTVYDITGKLVSTYKPNELKNQFKTDFYFANGAYIAKIKLDNGTVVAKKLMN